GTGTSGAICVRVTCGPVMKQIKKKLANNLSRVREEIASACSRSGRETGEVTLVVVTKSVGLDVIRANEGDYEIGVAGRGVSYQEGVMLATVRQNQRDYVVATVEVL
ncbi:hypothetical protein LCGC14_2630700, partial [marine sediment metagenome]